MEAFIKQLKTAPESIDFSDTMKVIETHYKFTETAFKNGALYNAAGENSGSCKLFAFARLQGLTEAETLACFGAYYREDVLNNPDADNHQNIRHFMKTGWNGLEFSAEPLHSVI